MWKWSSSWHLSSISMTSTAGFQLYTESALPVRSYALPQLWSQWRIKTTSLVQSCKKRIHTNFSSMRNGTSSKDIFRFIVATRVGNVFILYLDFASPCSTTALRPTKIRRRRPSTFIVKLFSFQWVERNNMRHFRVFFANATLHDNGTKLERLHKAKNNRFTLFGKGMKPLRMDQPIASRNI